MIYESFDFQERLSSYLFSSHVSSSYEVAFYFVVIPMLEYTTHVYKYVICDFHMIYFTYNPYKKNNMLKLHEKF